MYHLPPIKGTRNSYWFVGCLRAFSNRGTSEVASGRRHQVGPQLGEVRKICFELRTTFCCGMKVQAFKLPNIWSLNLWKRFVLEAFQKNKSDSDSDGVFRGHCIQNSFVRPHSVQHSKVLQIGFSSLKPATWDSLGISSPKLRLHRRLANPPEWSMEWHRCIARISLMSFASTKVSRGPNGRPLLTTIMSGISCQVSITDPIRFKWQFERSFSLDMILIMLKTWQRKLLNLLQTYD